MVENYARAIEEINKIDKNYVFNTRKKRAFRSDLRDLKIELIRLENYYSELDSVREIYEPNKIESQIDLRDLMAMKLRIDSLYTTQLDSIEKRTRVILSDENTNTAKTYSNLIASIDRANLHMWLEAWQDFILKWSEVTAENIEMYVQESRAMQRKLDRFTDRFLNIKSNEKMVIQDKIDKALDRALSKWTAMNKEYNFKLKEKTKTP